MCNVAHPLNRPFNGVHPRPVLLSLDVLIEQELLLFALMISLAGLRGIGWILAYNSGTLAAAVLIHSR